MQTSDRTRGVALLVPRLLSIQAEPAETETADALADAIERSAEALLRWHDEIAEIGERRPALAPPAELPLAETPTDGSAHASPRLAQRVREGAIPADPASLEAAASELRSIARAIERAASASADAPIRRRGTVIADALAGLSDALRELADTLRTESRRLADVGPAGAAQVLGRVVRAEHAARLAAAATLRV